MFFRYYKNMKYIENPLNYQIVKQKFIENNIPYDKESIYYFSSKKQLQIDNNLLEKFIDSTMILKDLLLELIEEFQKGNFIELYCFDKHVQDCIYASLNNPYLALRFDWGIENNQPKLFEINAESCGFLTECSLISTWLNNDFNNNSPDYNLYEKYVQNILNLDSKETLYLASLDYIYDRQNLHWIKNFLHMDNVKIININDIEEDESHLYYQGNNINFLHKIYPWEWIIEDGNIETFKNICVTEPIWTTLLSSKFVLYLLFNKYKKYSIFLETYYNESVSGKYIEKSFSGTQGSSVIKSNGYKKWHDSILQRRINPLKIEKDNLIFNTWLINNEFAGIGVKVDNKTISNSEHKFVPLTIE